MLNKKEKPDIDTLLSKALKCSETPSHELMRKVKSQLIKEDSILKKYTLKRSFTVAAVVAAVMILSTTALAAWYFLKPSQIADQLGDEKLSSAFDDNKNTITGKSETSGNYVFTLLGVVSGKDITDNPTYNEIGDILSDRTYTVVAIQKKDGSPMPSPQDDEYTNTTFYISPYVKGLKPWQVNMNTLNGGYYETVVDGVMYRISDCNAVTMFADKGVYLGINSGSFYNPEAFSYDEATGVLSPNKDFDGVNVVYDLPIDKALADPEKAAQCLNNLFGSGEDDSDDTQQQQSDTNVDTDSLPAIIIDSE